MDALEALLSEWAAREHHRGKGFISDGIVAPGRWTGARRKVLLLLKEAYGDPGSTDDWDLRQVIREEWQGPKYNIWWAAASWCYAAQNAAAHVPECPSTDDAWAAASAQNQTQDSLCSGSQRDDASALVNVV